MGETNLKNLPIGVFAFAFGTVSLAEMSKAAARDDIPSLADMYTFSLRNLLYVTLPITVFMLLSCEELITACPLCMYNLVENATVHRLPVKYFTELLAEALGVKEG